MGILDDASIDLTCPDCGHKTSKTIGWLRHDPDSFECAGCGETVVLDYTEPGLYEAFEGIDESVDSLQRAIEEINESFKRLS